MKMSGQISCCVTLLLTLTSVSAVRRALNSITDLRSVGFGQSVPEYSLRLLHWFANEIYINNDKILLTFDPIRGDYGSHYYRNDEMLLDPVPRGYRYYSVGNIDQDASLQLPDYVTDSDIEETNRARIIIRVRQQNAIWTIDQVYITQHYETHEHQGTEYDPQHTYPVTTCLLRAIRRFSLNHNDINLLMSLRDHFSSHADDSQLQNIKDIWGDLACLGLFLFIVIPEKYFSHKHNSRHQPTPSRNTQPDCVGSIPESRKNVTSGMSAKNQVDHRNGITLKVTTDKRGNARITWSNVHSDFLRQGVMVALYKNNQEEKALTFTCIGNKASGNYDTSIPLNEGLQVRLHEVRTRFLFWKSLGKELDRGSELNAPPVNITGYNANLQLFAKDGKACARLIVTKSFQDWRSKFKNAWVGFYSSENKATNNYEWWQWQWATKLKENTDFQDIFYDVYEYESDMTITPGVQARFILQDEIEKAKTLPWGE